MILSPSVVRCLSCWVLKRCTSILSVYGTGASVSSPILSGTDFESQPCEGWGDITPPLHTYELKFNVTVYLEGQNVCG